MQANITYGTYKAQQDKEAYVKPKPPAKKVKDERLKEKEKEAAKKNRRKRKDDLPSEKDAKRRKR